MALTKVTTHVIADDIALGGNPTTTTQSAGNNTTRIATTAFVTGALADLTDSAPSTLNTLNELAAALGDDANFSTTVTNSIAAKLPLAGGTMTGALNMGSQNITAANRISTADGIADTGSAGSSTIFNESGSTADFRIESDSDTHMFFLDGGLNRIGIGTSSPSQKLHILGGGILVDNGSSAGTIYFHDTTNYINLSSDELQFANNGAERMRIDSSGLVGIGTNDPAEKLQVSLGAGDFVSAINSSSTVASSNFWGYALHEGTTLIGEFTCVRDGTTNQLYIGGSSANQTLSLGVGEKSIAMRIDASGKVGIGQTSPNANLHVGSSNATGDATNPAIQIGGTSNYRLGMYTDGETAIFENKNGDDGFEFRVKTAGEVLRINGGTGQVQAYPLGVANPSYSFTNDTNTGMTRPTGDTLQFVTGGAEKMRISSGTGVSSEAAVIRAADNVDIRSTHYANFEGGGWSSTDNNVNVRKALHEAVYGSYNVDFEPGAYSNGIYYVLAGKGSGTTNSYIKFKIALNKATHLKINQTVSNSADATARVTSIHYSFDDYVYTQAASAAFNAGTESTTATLDFDSIGTMSGMGSSYDGTFTGNIYVRMRLYLGSSIHNTLIGWRSIGFEAKAEDMKLLNAGGPQYGNVETAMFTMTSSSASTLVTNNGGYIDLAQHSNGGYMNPEIFELDNNGNYGVHIKRDGKVLVTMAQDFITSNTSGYFASRIYRAPANDANNRVMSYQLTPHAPDTTTWSTIQNHASFDVNAGDRVQFYVVGGTVTNLDAGNWSQYIITWIDSQHSGSANKAVATYQENAHYNFTG